MVKRYIQATVPTFLILGLLLGCAGLSPGRAVDPIVSHELVSQSFIDPNNGWVVAAECPKGAPTAPSVACRSVIYGTADGGHTWSITARILLTPRKIRFTDAHMGWLIGSIGKSCGANVCPNVVMRSKNGGKTWDRVSTVSGELVDEAAFSGDDAWAVGQVCTDSASCRAEFVRTSSAGQIWDNRDLPIVGYEFQLERFGLTSGWIRGTVDRGLGSVLIATSDGGSTWQERAQPCQGGWSRVSFRSATAGWLICLPTSDDIASGAIAQVFQTSDAGRAWSRRGTVSDAAELPTTSPRADADPVGGFSFLTPELGWFALTDGRVFATNDGGVTWRKRLSNAPGPGDLTFVSPAIGWVLGQTKVWSTTDAGVTWTASDIMSDVPT